MVQEEAVLEAAKSGNLSTLKSLQDGEVTTIKDKNGATCLHYAARGDSVETLDFLMKQGFNAITRSNVGATAAHDAAATGSLPALQWILANTKCLVDDQDGNGATVLHLAARYGHAQTVKWLIEDGNCDISKTTANCALPIHFAVAGGNMECVKIIIKEAPRSVNIQTNTGETPVYLASQHGHLEMLKFLVLEAGGSTRMKSFDGMSLLHAAAQMNHLDCVKWLVDDQKVNPNDRDFDGATPLHFAGSRGQTRVVEWLLQHGGGLITLDNLGGSPLHNAAEMGQQECIQVLLDNGCDPDIVDNNGLTAAELAEKCHQQTSAALIKGETILDSTQFPSDFQLPRLNQDVFEAIQRNNENCPPLTEVKPVEEIEPSSERHVSLVSASCSNSETDVTFQSARKVQLVVLADVHSERHDSDCSVYSQETGESEREISSPVLQHSQADDLKDFAAAVLQDSRRNDLSSSASTLSSFSASATQELEDVESDLQILVPASRDDQTTPLADLRSQFELLSHSVAQSRETQKNFVNLLGKKQGEEKIKMSNTNGIDNTQVSNPGKKMTVIEIKGNNVKINDSAGVREITTPPGGMKPGAGNSMTPSLTKGGNSSQITVGNNSSQMSASRVSNSNQISSSVGNNVSQISVSGAGNSSERPKSGAGNSNQISGPGTANCVVKGSVTVNAVSNGISRLQVDSSSKTRENVASVSSSGPHVTQASQQPVRSVSPANPALARTPLASILLSTAPKIVASPPSSPSAVPPAGSSPANQRKDLNESLSSSNSSPEIRSSGLSNNPFIYQNGHAPVKHDIIAELKASSGASGLKKSRGPERGATKEVFSFGGKSRTQPANNTANDTKPSNPLVGEWDPKHFLDQVPEKDASGHEIPEWRRHMMAKHEAEKTKKETEEKRKIELEEARFVNMPAWKRALIEKKEQQTGSK